MNLRLKLNGYSFLIYINHPINCTIRDNARTVITACKSRLSTNNANTFNITLIANDITKILNLSLIFPSHANNQKFSQLKQLNIKKGHKI